MVKIALFNQKGGVGKTTLTANIGHGLALLGLKVLIIDLDGNNDCSLMLGISKANYNLTFFELLRDRVPVEECIINVRENLDLLPNSNIKEIDSILHTVPRIDFILGDLLDHITGYDYILIDCSPTKNKINDAVLCWTDKLIVPVKVETPSVVAIGNVYGYIAELRLKASMVALVVPTMYDKQTNDGREKLEMIYDFFKNTKVKVAEPIPIRAKIKESVSEGKTVLEHDSNSAEYFFNVVEDIVKGESFK